MSSSLSSSRRIDAICGQFEAAWRSGQRTPIEGLVAAADPEDRPGLLGELIVLECELRTVAGEAVRVEDYLARFPGDEQIVRAALAQSDVPAVARRGENRAAWAAAERYRLGEQVGRGGMGVVVSAHDRQLDRELAVKLLAEPLQTRREARERFLREARICARLQHPGIIPVHEMGWLGERPYYAMKLVRGRSLAELLKGRPDPDPELPRWLEVFERACETVAYTHAQGIVHRDLKPANVMLGSFGEVYVIDWGLAKRMPPGETSRSALPNAEQGVGGDARPVPVAADSAAPDQDALTLLQADASAAWTFLGDVAGTPQYMSPEQARGDADAADPRTDVFALGAMLCEILTGASPYPAGDPDARLEQAQQGDLAETLARLDACPADRELLDLARDCLAVQPADRPPDAGHVSQRMTTFQRSVQQRLQRLELERIEARTRAEERRRRRRIVLTLAAGLALLAVLLAAGTTWTAWREAARRRDEAASRAQVQRQLTETLDEVAQLYAGAPEDWRQDPPRRTRIRELARRAETLAENPWAQSTLAGRVRDLRDRILAEDADGRLLESLEKIRLQRAEANPRTNKFASGRTRPLYRKAFADYGLAPAAISTQQAVARIKGRPVHVVEACIFGLEGWRGLFKQKAEPGPWIDAVLDGIDENGWRRAVREACRAHDWPAVGELLEAARDQPLSADVVNLAAMRLINARQFELAVRLLRPAQPDHPGDFWINQYLGIVYYSLPDRRLDESVRFFTAALAIRETGAAYVNLGAAFSVLQRYPEAEQAFRAALRLQPDYAHAHLGLAEVLQAQNRVEEALASVAQALAAAPDLPEAVTLRDQLMASIGKRGAGGDASTDGKNHTNEGTEARDGLR